MLTAMMLKRPIRADRIPPEITTLHKGRPRLSMLVATLFRLPSVLKPIVIIARPRKTRPDSSLSNGQFLAKYFLNSSNSETIRKIEIALVMK